MRIAYVWTRFSRLAHRPIAQSLRGPSEGYRSDRPSKGNDITRGTSEAGAIKHAFNCAHRMNPRESYGVRVGNILLLLQ